MFVCVCVCNFKGQNDGTSPLITACLHGFDDVVGRLLQAPNVNINHKRKSDDCTALFAACRKGSAECVKCLLQNPQCRVNEPKKNGRTPLFIASFFGYYDVVEALINHANKMQKRGMKHGVVDVNQPDSKGFSPLFVAAQNGFDEVVTLLLQTGVSFFFSIFFYFYCF